jgi:hypothetical protein
MRWGGPGAGQACGLGGPDRSCRKGNTPSGQPLADMPGQGWTQPGRWRERFRRGTLALVSRAGWLPSAPVRMGSTCSVATGRPRCWHGGCPGARLHETGRGRAGARGGFPSAAGWRAKPSRGGLHRGRRQGCHGLLGGPSSECLRWLARARPRSFHGGTHGSGLPEAPRAAIPPLDDSHYLGPWSTRVWRCLLHRHLFATFALKSSTTFLVM